MSSSPPKRSSEQGQVIGLIVVFMVALLGVSALVIDFGNWYYNRQSLRAAADAAALAGAGDLAVSQSTANASAASEFGLNKRSGDTASVAITQDLTPGDSVTVTATRHVSSFFARVFGHSSTTITVTARATIESYTTYASTGNVMPFGVMKGNYTPGVSYTIYGDGSSSNNGALSLDLKSGAGCGKANGANDLSDTIDGSAIACPITVGQTVDTKPGNNTGKISQGLNSRMSGGWTSFNQIMQPKGNGQYNPATTSSPQLVVVPIVTDNGGGTTWPQGSGTVKIYGFAYFVITGCGNPTKPGPCANSDGKYVNGTFVGMMDATAAGTTGAWNPSSGTASTMALTS